MPVVYFMCGPAASGKSRFVEKSFDNVDYAHVAYDLIRNNFYSGLNISDVKTYPEAWALFKAETVRLLKKWESTKKSVVIDFRNLTKQTRKRRLDLFGGEYRKIAYVFPPPDDKVKGSLNVFYGVPGYDNPYIREIEDSVSRFEPPEMAEGFDEIRPWHGGI